jgi:hypothetical protein
MRRAAELGLFVLAAACCVATVAQAPDAPRAPRIIGTPSPAPRAPEPASEPGPGATPVASLVRSARPPNAARLAPLPEQRGDEPDEIVVIGQAWRLPDLGSEWRARQQEAAREGRLNAVALPLYDPSKPPLHSEYFQSREQRRHGYIELFRLRFGQGARRDEEED